MKPFLRPWACALALICAAPAQATVIDLAGDGQWRPFAVDRLSSDSAGVEWIDADNSLDPNFGTPLSFAFTIAAGDVGTLTVVDLLFAGDTFELTNFGSVLGSTTAVAVQSFATAPFEADPDAALADASFSRGSYLLGSGSYLVAGRLLQSVLDDLGTPIDATGGALRLTVSPIPEPDTMALLAGGLLALVAAARRRGR